MKLHQNLTVYQKAMDLVVTIYSLTKKFPSEEKFGLTSQMRKSAVSVPSNIAEGAHDRAQRILPDFSTSLSVL